MFFKGVCMKKKCASCIIYENKVQKLLKENVRLNNIVNILNDELSDKIEWIENIKNEIVNISVEEKNIKDNIFKLKKKINKLA